MGSSFSQISNKMLFSLQVLLFANFVKPQHLAKLNTHNFSKILYIFNIPRGILSVFVIKCLVGVL